MLWDVEKKEKDIDEQNDDVVKVDEVDNVSENCDHKCHTNTIQRWHKYHTNAMQIPYKYHENTTQIPHKNLTNTIQMAHKYQYYTIYYRYTIDSYHLYFMHLMKNRKWSMPWTLIEVNRSRDIKIMVWEKLVEKRMRGRQIVTKLLPC